MTQRILLITPPLIQPNTPYPATVYLKGFLNSGKIDNKQIDLSLETLLSIFSKKGLTELFKYSSDKINSFSDNALRIFSLSGEYISTIDNVISFLQGKNQNLSQLICDDQYLPQASRFENIHELDQAFGSMGYRDKARHLATLYLEDLCDFITEVADQKFGFSRYAESLGRCASSFDEIYAALKERSFTDCIMLELLENHIKEYKPDMVVITIPFPGNLYSALTCGKYIKVKYPDIKIEMGGGFVNTELRSLQDERMFEFTDYLTLDDGEIPLLKLIGSLDSENPDSSEFVRTFMLKDGKVVYVNNEESIQNIPMSDAGTPDYGDLHLDKYLSLIDVVNPMHKLWSDGRWNKLTLAHGCYWGKCSFCDCSLDYIGRYEPVPVNILVDRIEEMINKTGENGFHFVDEAAPPVLLKELAIEILKRGINITWWTNVRFEKTYTDDLCRLLKASGCIAVAGGLEVASERILKLINKGVSIEQVAKVTSSFVKSDIMVHAYLMYGFPSQTEQETIDSLEVVRQLFEAGVVNSGFWHRFALTAHSPVGLNPDKFNIKPHQHKFGGFADNDRFYDDLTGADHEIYGDGLRKSLYNFMHGIGTDFPLNSWFDFRIPKTKIKRNLIYNSINKEEHFERLLNKELIWIGGLPLKRTIKQKGGRHITEITINNKTSVVELSETSDICDIVYDMLLRCSVKNNIPDFIADSDLIGKRVKSEDKEIRKYRLKDLKENLRPYLNIDFESFCKSEFMTDLFETGLLII